MTRKNQINNVSADAALAIIKRHMPVHFKGLQFDTPVKEVKMFARMFLRKNKLTPKEALS